MLTVTDQSELQPTGDNWSVKDKCESLLLLPYLHSEEVKSYFWWKLDYFQVIQWPEVAYVLIQKLNFVLNVWHSRIPCLNFSTGSYLYMNMSIPHVNGGRAIITSPLQTPSPDGRCLTFWYHMLGIRIDTLAVYVNEGENRKLVFKRSGSQGDEWIRAEKTIETLLPWTVKFHEICES